jgi:hypothetical protein
MTDTDPRGERLAELAASKQAADVCSALKGVWKAGRRPERIVFRRQFARLDAPVRGPVSDRKLPARPARPPSTRLIYPKGVAQSFYLTMLFVAQCERGPGQVARVGRPLSATPSSAPDVSPWSDLVMVPAERQPGSTSHLVETNRLRQLEAAVKALAADEVRLVALPHGGEARGKLRDFTPLMESGYLGRASRVPYAVPQQGDAVFSVPASFFLNGWPGVLSPSELAMLFAVWASSPDDSASKSRVFLEGDTRIRHYGLSPAAYASQRFLQELDVLHVDVPSGRRSDGTFVGHKKGDSPLLNSFTVMESGFSKPALSVVMPSWKVWKGK